MSIFGGIASLIGNTVSGIYAADKQNEYIDKQIEAQQKENEKTREYNLNLAKQQNKWNIEQWQRENKYNSPAAQMQRFQAAGLNPNLIYGQSNTSGQISGSMTSGAAASPVDMSALGNKRSGVASALRSLGEGLMNIPLYREQVRSLKIDNDRKQEDNEFVTFLRNVGSEGGSLPPQWQKFQNSYAGEREINQVNDLWLRVQKQLSDYPSWDEEGKVKEYQAQIERDAWRQIKQFSHTMKISPEDAKNVFFRMMNEAAGVKFDTDVKKAESIMSDPSFLEKLPNGLPALAKFLRMVIK